MEEKITEETIIVWLMAYICKQTGIPEDEMDIDVPISTYALDSIDSVTLAADVGKWLNISVPSTVVWDYPSIEKLTSYLLKQTNKT